MDTARCRAFVAAAKSGSFSKAAEELNYTTSGVSQLVAALEADLRVSLFQRSRHGVTLTADGERIYPVIYNFVRQEDRVYEAASEISGLLVGEITIAAYPSICATWLPGIIAEFQKAHPGVTFRIEDSIRRDVVLALSGGRADIGFLSNHHDISGEWTELVRNPMLALVSHESPYAELESFPLSECARADMIQSSHGRDLDLMAIFRGSGISPRIVYTTRNSSTAAAMAENNMGVFISNELSTHMWHYNVKMLPLDPPQYVTLGMIVSPMSTNSPAVRAFARLVRRKFRHDM